MASGLSWIAMWVCSADGWPPTSASTACWHVSGGSEGKKRTWPSRQRGSPGLRRWKNERAGDGEKTRGV